MTGRNTMWLSAEDLVAELNPVLRGWADYFCMGPCTKAYRAVNAHVAYRFGKWWLADRHPLVPSPPDGATVEWERRGVGRHADAGQVIAG